MRKIASCEMLSRSCPFRSTVLQCGARLQIHKLNYWTVQAVVPVFMVCRMCQCGLHAVLWSLISILMRFLDFRPSQYRITLFPSQCFSGKILPTMYSMVWDLPVFRAGPLLFYWIKLLAPFQSSTVFLFSSFYRLVLGSGVFRLICKSLSPAFHCLPFNNNNNEIIIIIIIIIIARVGDNSRTGVRYILYIAILNGT